MAWVWLLFAAAGPVGVAMLVVHFPAVADRVEDGWRRLRHRSPVPDSPPIECLAADLRRLGRHLELVESSNELAKAFRMRAASRAYDDVLLCAARVLEVDTGAHAPLEPVERLETEAALAQHGLQW
jgi:hypothetical protein